MKKIQSCYLSFQQRLIQLLIPSPLHKLLFLLLGVLSLHLIAMMVFENLNFFDSLWLTITSATTVGYGDLSAQTLWGRLSTIILLYLFGIALLAQAIGGYFEYRQDKRLRKLQGHWRWIMNSHIVFLNCPQQNSLDYFYHVISQLRATSSTASQTPVVLVSDQLETLPEKLRALNVVSVNKNPLDPSSFDDAALKNAGTVVILAEDYSDLKTDSINFDLLTRLTEYQSNARIIIEVITDTNKARFLKFGADNVIRPIRAYPELLARAIVSPDSEQAMLDIFNSHNEEFIRYNVQAKTTWKDIVSLLVSNDLGTPLSFLNQDNHVISNAIGSDHVDIRALFVVVPRGRLSTDTEIQSLLTNDI